MFIILLGFLWVCTGDKSQGGGKQSAMGGAEPGQGGLRWSLLKLSGARAHGRADSSGWRTCLETLSTWWKAKALPTRGQLSMNT